MSAVVHRVGPARGSVTREFRTRSGPARVVATVEVWGIADPERRGAFEHRLAEAICDGFGASGGSTTARIRHGLDVAERMVRKARAVGDSGADSGSDRDAGSSLEKFLLLGAGASVIVHEGMEITLAQAGPSVAYGPGEDGLPRRIPAESPWLRRGERTLRPDLEWPAIGTAPGGAPIVHWTRFTASPGTMVVAAGTTAAEHLGREVIAALFATPATRAGHALAIALPDDMPAVLLALPGAVPSRRTAGRGTETAPTAEAVSNRGATDLATGELSPSELLEDSARVARQSGEDILSPSERRADSVRAVRESGGNTLSPSERLADSARAAREFGADIAVRSQPALAKARTALGGLALWAARVIVGLLPSRTADGVRAEWSRLMAAIALGLPFAVLALTAIIAARSMSNRVPDVEFPAGAPAAPELPPNIASDEARGIRRLEGADLVLVPLAGNPGDSREIVVAGGRQYVLNRELSLVERIDGDATVGVRVLERGSVVGGDVVGAIEDLFWLPGGSEVAPAIAPAAPVAPAAPASSVTGGRAAALDGAGRVWAIDGDTITAVPLGSGPRWRAVSRAASFNGDLYALDRAGDIFRYDLGVDAGLPPEGVAWLTSDESLDEAVDMAIGGSLWVLYGEGQLISFVGGRRSSVGPLGLPAREHRARSIYAAPDGRRLLISDAGSGGVITLDGDGRFVAELRLPTQWAAEADSDAQDGRFTELHSTWWDQSTATLWVVAGNTLYKSPFDG